MQLIKRHWRLFIPIVIMLIIFCFSASPSSVSESASLPIAEFLGLPHGVTRKIAHFVLFAGLGASWYYYLRSLGKFTPGFTSLGSLLFVILYAFIDEFHQTFVPGRTGLLSDVLLNAISGLVGIIIFGTIHFITRSKEQKKHRRKQVDKIWQNHHKLVKKFKKTKNSKK
jgi:VanZ family protein